MSCINTRLRAPFSYFGGKSLVADALWQRFGDTPNYCEPFFGSGAVLLGRPAYEGFRKETVNDADAFLANFWRAVQAAPHHVAEFADYPISEIDLHARHQWLIERSESLAAFLKSDPANYDVKIAGWWVWGKSQWIGGAWCSPASLKKDGTTHRRIPALCGHGQGIHGVKTDAPALLKTLSYRLRRVRICCGDWSRILTPAVSINNGLCSVLLDPPYSNGIRAKDLYAKDDGDVAADVRAWCLENGGHPKLRIALCGYEGEHEALEEAGWSVLRWKANGGFGNQAKGRPNENAVRERIWFSPNCLPQSPA